MGHHLLGAWADGGLQVMASMAQKVFFHKTWWFEIANTCKYWKWHMNYHEFQDAIANDANVNNGTNRLMFKFNQIHLSMGTYNHPEVDKYHNFNHIPTFLRILLKYPYSIIFYLLQGSIRKILAQLWLHKESRSGAPRSRTMPWSNPESEDRCSKNRPVYVI